MKKEDFYDGLNREYKAALKAKDAEKAVYYRQAMTNNTSGVASFDKQFKGSWAYDQWLKKNKEAIAAQQAEFKRFAYLGESKNTVKKSELKALIEEVLQEMASHQSVADIAFKVKFVAPGKDLVTTHRLDNFHVNGSGRQAFEKGVQEWLDKQVEQAKQRGKSGISMTLVPGTLQILTEK